LVRAEVATLANQPIGAALARREDRHRADLGVHHAEDSGFLAEPQLELCTMPLRRIQHYPVFFEHYELRAGESEGMLNKEEHPFGITLPVMQQFFGTPFVDSDDAAGARCGNACTSPSPTLA
jgi:hypothetical protein